MGGVVGKMFVSREVFGVIREKMSIYRIQAKNMEYIK